MMRTGIAAVAMSLGALAGSAQEEGWISLFDGKSLEGWRINENPESAWVEDGVIVTRGKPRAHLFYAGPVEDHDFKNFELKLEVKCEPGANAGVYFHTEFQETGWPAKGYEAQVNISHKDWRKTGSLYAVVDRKAEDLKVKDGEWWEYHIIVKGNRIVLKVNGETTVDYTEPEGADRPKNMKGRRLSSGTFALQCHDPGSTVYFRNIRVKPLP